MQLKRVAEAKLPTPWGDFLMVGFEELATGHDHVALVLWRYLRAYPRYLRASIPNV